MASVNVTNCDLLKELQNINSSFDAKVTKLNTYYIGRLVHFERQLNILMEESNNCKQEFSNLNAKFKHACDEIKDLQKEVITLKKGVTPPVTTNTDEFNTRNNETVGDSNAINTTLNDMFTKDLITVKTELNTIKQNNIVNDVVITGIPEVVNENLLATVNKVLVNYKLEVKSADIKNIYRLKNSKCGIYSPILLQLKNEDIKQSIFAHQKVNGPVLIKNDRKDISLNDFQCVFFKHRLTSDNLALLRSARKFGRENKYEFTWTTNDGKILMRRNANARAIKISCFTDLQELQK